MEDPVIRWLLLGLAALLIGGGILLWSDRTEALVAASAAWPGADGTVVHSQLVRREVRSSAGGVSRTEYVYGADVRYAYEVGGRRHESDVYVLGVSNDFRHRRSAEQRVGAHPAGSVVRVSYDPRDPARSTLVAGATGPTMPILKLMAGALAAAGLAALLVGVRAARASWRTMREWTTDPNAEARRRRRDAGWM